LRFVYSDGFTFKQLKTRISIDGRLIIIALRQLVRTMCARVQQNTNVHINIVLMNAIINDNYRTMTVFVSKDDFLYIYIYIHENGA